MKLTKISWIKYLLIHIKILLSILKGSPLEKTTRIVTYTTVMYVNHIQLKMFITLYNHLLFPYVHL